MIEQLKVGQEVCLSGGCGVTRYTFDWSVKSITKTKIVLQRGSSIRSFNKYGEELGVGVSSYRDKIVIDVQQARQYTAYEEARCAAMRRFREMGFEINRYSGPKNMNQIIEEHEKKLAELKELVAAIPELKE